jgi:hypothetical protein
VTGKALLALKVRLAGSEISRMAYGLRLRKSTIHHLLKHEEVDCGGISKVKLRYDRKNAEMPPEDATSQIQLSVRLDT